MEIGINAFAGCTSLDELPDGAVNDENYSDPADDEDTTANGIDPEFKKAMDEYEKFFDEYVAFMLKYKAASPSDAAALMGEYSNMMSQYVEAMQALEDIDQDELSKEEVLYYSEVMLRISQKLLEVA